MPCEWVGEQPRDCGRVNSEQSGGISSRFTPGDHSCNLGPLLRPFVFSKRPDHLHHHSASRYSCVDCFCQTPKGGSGPGQTLHNHQNIPERTGQTGRVSTRREHRPCEADPKPVKLGPVPPRRIAAACQPLRPFMPPRVRVGSLRDGYGRQRP